MNTMLKRLRAVLLLAVVPALLAGCDAVATDAFELPPRRVQFEFVFQGGSLIPGNPNEITSRNEANLLAYVESRNFTSADVVGVRIVNQSAELEVARPVSGRANHFLRAQVRPFQGTATLPFIIGGTGFGDSSTAPLQIESSAFANVIRTGPFAAQLLIEPNPALIQNVEYLIRVTFDVVIEVEG